MSLTFFRSISLLCLVISAGVFASKAQASFTQNPIGFSRSAPKLSTTRVVRETSPEIEKFLSDTLARINSTFGLTLVYSIEPPSDYIGSTVCTVRIDEGKITICDDLLAMLIDGRYGEQTKSILAFVLAHEASHALIDPDYLNLDLQKLQGMNELRFGGVKVKSHTAWAIAVELFHENVDALAAKIIRELGFGVKGPLEFLNDLPKLVLAPAEADAVLENAHMYSLLQRGRRMATLNSYQEGWQSWKGFHRVNSACADGDLRGFAKSRGYSEILKLVGETRETCPEIPAEEADEAIREGLRRAGLGAEIVEN